MNKQPFYYRAVILFTSTNEKIPKKDLRNWLNKISCDMPAEWGIIPTTLEIDEIDCEPGDPSDLVH